MVALVFGRSRLPPLVYGRSAVVGGGGERGLNQAFCPHGLQLIDRKFTSERLQDCDILTQLYVWSVSMVTG